MLTKSLKPLNERLVPNGDLYFEWCSASLNRCGNLAPVSKLEVILKRPNPGYGSVYYFNADDAKRIRASGCSRGFSALVVTAFAVTLDIDNPLDIQQVVDRLDGLGLGYQLWFSGRGYHVVIPHERMSDINLPYSHRCWVETLNLPVDYSLYQHSRVLRLPNTLNAKTGLRKQLIKEVEGMQPTIQIKEPPKFQFQPNGGVNTVVAVLNQLQRIVSTEPLPGNRHTQLWSAATAAANANLSYTTTLELLTEVNNSWKNPKSSEEVEKAVTQAYAPLRKLEQE